MIDNLIDIENLYKIKRKWKSKNYNTSIGEGAISLTAISLAINSAEFLGKNSNLISNGTSRVSPAHVEVGGLLIGIGIAALAQDDLTYQDIPDLITAGIITGVVASSGIAGKIGKWLFG